MTKIKGVSLTIRRLKKELDDKKSSVIKAELNKTLTALKSATPVDTGEARDGWYITGNTIENDVPHIKFLNEGSSQQAPAHFIEQTIINNHNLIVRGIIVRDK